jgi:hypothetical protein
MNLHISIVLVVASTAAAGCTLNGKPLAWPGGEGAGGSGETSLADDGSDAAQTSPTVAGKVPAWCEVDGVEAFDALSVASTLRAEDANTAIHELAGHFCHPDHESIEHWEELEAVRTTWSRRLRMNDADWRDAVEWALRPQLERNSPSLDVDDKRGLSSLDGIDQYAVISSSYHDKAYLTDAFGPRLTEIGRLAYVEECLQRDAVGGWLMCHGDVLAFDPKRIVAELRASKARSGYERFTVRLKMAAIAPKVEARIAAMQQLIDGDAAYGSLLAVADQARARWAARGTDDEYLTLALALDDARRVNSRSKYAGCATSTWSAFERAVAALPAERFANISDEPGRSFAEKAVSVMLDDENAYLAASALAICALGETETPDYLVRTIAEELKFRPGQRGPRTAAHTALLTSRIALDDRDARLEYPEVEREWFPRSSGSSGGGQGIVAAVKTGEGIAVVGFAKELATYDQCTRWKTTDRLDRIDAEGRLHYETTCVATQKRTYDKASGPQSVNVRYLAEVEPGRYVTVTDDVVTAVWSKQGAGAPLAVFGIAFD